MWNKTIQYFQRVWPIFMIFINHCDRFQKLYGLKDTGLEPRTVESSHWLSAQQTTGYFSSSSHFLFVQCLIQKSICINGVCWILFAYPKCSMTWKGHKYHLYVRIKAVFMARRTYSAVPFFFFRKLLTSNFLSIVKKVCDVKNCALFIQRAVDTFDFLQCFVVELPFGSGRGKSS